MLDWITLRDPYIGGYGYNVFMWSGFAVWIWLTVRELSFFKEFWNLFRIVFFSFVGAVFIPLSILLIQTALNGQLFNYTSGISQLIFGIYTPEGFVKFFKFAFKGFSITAGILTLSVILLFIRKDWRRFFYPFVYPFPLFSAIIRLGCFSDGCCFGRPTDLPLGIVFPPGSYASALHYKYGQIASRYAPSLPVHPVQLYISVSMLLLFIVIVVMERRGIRRDIIAGVCLIGYGGANFFIEFVRQESRIVFGLFSAGQIIEILIVLIGAWVIRSALRPPAGSSAPDSSGTAA